MKTAHFLTFPPALLSFFLILFAPLQLSALEALKVRQVADGIYVHFGVHELPDRHNHGAIANIGFIVGERCVAVIDTGGNPEEGERLKKAVEQTTDKPVCYVINTHVHPDHIYGNIAFKQPGVEFVGHANLERAMLSRGQYYIDKAAEQLDIHLSPKNIIPPDNVVKQYKLLNLGNRELVVTAHPTAHTDNDLTVLDKKTNTLWLSDLMFSGHLPVLDGSLKGWLQVIEKLEKKQFNHVIPGHGGLVSNWPQAIKPQKDYLTMLLNEIRAKIAKGVYLEDAVNQVGLTARSKWQLFDEFHRKNVTTAFAELEWED